MTKEIKPTTNAGEIITEADLVREFVSVLQSGKTCWRNLEVMTEWGHPTGSADILVRTNSRGLIAFEAKLTEWRRAFHQAYRNSMYANRVYVLMPRKTVHRALQFRQDFELRGIGLCSYKDGKVQVHIRASEQDDLLSWVRRKAHESFDEVRDEPGDTGSMRQTVLRV